MSGPTRRINYGAGHAYDLDGERIAGVTKILDAGIPKGGLIKWAAETTAAYAVDHADELAALPPSEKLKKLNGARFEAKNAAAARGTRVHDYAARLLGGETVEVPDAYRDHVDRCLEFMAAWDIHEVAVEVTVVNRKYGYMGTADLLARVGGSLAVWLFDWKTGSGGIYPETALQLAAYSRAETMLVDGPDGTPASFEVAMPAIERACAVAIRADFYEVVPVDIGDDAFFTFLYAQQIARYADRPRTDFVGEALPAPLFEAPA